MYSTFLVLNINNIFNVNVYLKSQTIKHIKKKMLRFDHALTYFIFKYSNV